jgi:hypothetical protein
MTSTYLPRKPQLLNATEFKVGEAKLTAGMGVSHNATGSDGNKKCALSILYFFLYFICSENQVERK